MCVYLYVCMYVCSCSCDCIDVKCTLCRIHTAELNRIWDGAAVDAVLMIAMFEKILLDWLMIGMVGGITLGYDE